MPTIAKLLSTKKLQPAQRSRLLAAGFAVQSYDAVQAQAIDFDMPAAPFQGIFTSQHAVQAFLDHEHLSTALPMLEAAYCVGERSAQKLRKKGIEVALVADSAAALVSALFTNTKPKKASAAAPTVKDPKKVQAAGPTAKDFEKAQAAGPTARDLKKAQATGPTARDLKKAQATGQHPSLQAESPLFYFCGDRHLPSIPNAFKVANTPLETRIIYRSQGVHKAFDTPFEVLFFYSPSGVQAFCHNNQIGNAFVVAIGPTTAAEVALHTPKYTVAKRPSFAHMLSALRASYPKNNTH